MRVLLHSESLGMWGMFGLVKSKKETRKCLSWSIPWSSCDPTWCWSLGQFVGVLCVVFSWLSCAWNTPTFTGQSSCNVLHTLNVSVLQF